MSSRLTYVYAAGGVALLLYPTPIAPIGPTRGPSPASQWTVMVYLNADNNLEEAGLENFKQMAKVPNSPAVNIVLQFDRIAGDASTNPDWDQTLRFKVNNGMKPLPGAALEDLGEIDMGDTASLHQFVSWAKATYPAQHYILIMWNHGQGWRFAPGTTTRGSPYRSISFDDTDSSSLYNRGIQEALSREHVDVFGFDACLMAMVESAYAFRGLADYMVASEDLIPGLGWRYDDWLTQLVKKPSMTPRELADVLVESYRKTYEVDDPTTTLSAIDLSQIAELVGSINLLADALSRALPRYSGAVFEARTESLEYAPGETCNGRRCYHHVDIAQFASRAAAHLREPAVRKAATAVVEGVNRAVVANYSGSERQSQYGSAGLAIYFPLSQSDYLADVFEEGGYKKGNTFWPVAFVQEARWANFLSAYLPHVK